MSKFKLYLFSSETLTFREFRWAKTKLVGWGAVVGVIAMLSFIEVNERLGDRVGLGFTRTSLLIQENRVLRQQLLAVGQRIETLQNRLADINEEGNNLRLLVDLPKVDDDVRKAGTGGAIEVVDFNTSTDVSSMLNRLRSSITSAERELQLQVTSYREMAKRQDANKVRFAHLPAIRPMSGYYSKLGIGIRFHPILNIYRPHEGLDIANDVGTPVYASADGTVEFAGRSGGYGIMVEINHGYSYRSVYGHLSKVLVRDGQNVKRGDLIARSGNTGLSSGPHLHYEVRLNGVAQNPLEYFFNDVNYHAEAGQRPEISLRLSSNEEE